jgi:hypothetical protein
MPSQRVAREVELEIFQAETVGGDAVKKTRGLSKSSSSLTLSIFSLVISIIGAVLSGVQAQASVTQADLAQEQLTSAQRLFDESGPALNISSNLRFYDIDKPLLVSDLYYGNEPRTIDRSLVDEHQTTSLQVQVENSGREATTINDVWIDLRGSWGERHSTWLPSSDFPQEGMYCGEKPSGGEPCANVLPHTLDPGRVFYITFASLKDYYPAIAAERTCTDGIPVKIDAVGLRERPAQYLAPFRAE